MNISQEGTYRDSKPHYILLDGWRGVAALLVVFYHVCEGFAFAGDAPVISTFNHGYLAVDFFFMLSGFVLHYAYQERLRHTLSLRQFLLRRVIRLHPLVVLGAIVGGLTFVLQGCRQWNGHAVSEGQLVMAVLAGCLLLPTLPGSGREVRGNGEMFPLNGPSWSLFFEYIGNLLYAYLLQRLSTRWLAGFVGVTGVCWMAFVLGDVAGYGSLGVGWTLDVINGCGGFLRMVFPFSVGCLLARVYRPWQVHSVFIGGAVLLTGLFAVPYLPSHEGIHWNGVFECICVAGVFPILVRLGASGIATGHTDRLCRWLGNVSYPLYLMHYPVMYLFYHWLIKRQYYTWQEAGCVAIGVMAGCVCLAVVVFRLYDMPVRRWLAQRWLH